jgi:hypothetical protein
MPLSPMNRRTFLRTSGIAIGLPLLDAMRPQRAAGSQKKVEEPKRLLLVGRPLGMHAPNFFPADAGKQYAPSRYLRSLQGLRESFTVFSGLSHRYNAGHYAEVGLFTGVHPDFIRPNDIKNGISLDQEVALHWMGRTRFGALVLGGGSAAWNRRGVRLPSESRAVSVFKQLFLEGTAEETAREMRRIQEGRSILDGLREQLGGLNASLGQEDRERIDLYVSSIREAEQRLQQDEMWQLTPKPRVAVRPPQELGSAQLIERSRQWLELVHLAFRTDSTRVVSLWLGSQDKPEIPGVNIGHHDASHHGQDPAKLEQLALIEEAEVRVFGEFLEKLKSVPGQDGALLDRSTVLYTSNLGNASNHDNANLPVILAGGGYRHAGHVVHDRQNNALLSNLFVRILQEMELPVEKFGASTGTCTDV